MRERQSTILLTNLNMDDENATAIESNIVDQVTPSKVKKERAKKTPFVVKQGLGIYLFEIPHFYLELQARESSSVACKALHSLLFGTSGRKNEIKRNLLLFSGFPAEVSTKEKKLKVLRNKEVWTTTIIEEVLGMLGLETHGDKFDIVDRLIDFLAEPIVGTKTRRRRKRDTKSDKKQIKRLKKAESIKKSHSAYILYCMDQRATLAEELMLLPFKEQGVLLGTKWKALDEEAKKVLQSIGLLYLQLYSALLCTQRSLLHNLLFCTILSCTIVLGGEGCAGQTGGTAGRQCGRHRCRKQRQ